MRLSQKAQDTLLTLSVGGSTDALEIIGASYAIYYMEGQVHPMTLLHQAKKIKDGYRKLGEHMAALDNVIDELEGREPPVKVDEQEAA